MSRGRHLLRRLHQDADHARILDNAARTQRLVGRRSPAADHARIRGIPIQGAPGVSGTQLGTRPGGFIDRIRDDE